MAQQLSDPEHSAPRNSVADVILQLHLSSFDAILRREAVERGTSSTSSDGYLIAPFNPDLVRKAPMPDASCMHRRDVLVHGAAAALLAALLGSIEVASAQPAPSPPPSPAEWEKELSRILKGAKPIDEKFTLDVTTAVDNGNIVPFTVSVESPMTTENHIRAIHLLATGNPQPMVGVYRIGPDNGVAMVSSRMRLAQTQDVVAVVERSDSAFIVAKRTVKVTIACCGY
jgi:sulfur-oxidizing protein SoxY